MFKKKVPKPSRPDGAAPGKTGGDGAPPGPPGGIPPHLRPQEAKKGAPPPGAPPPNAIKPGQKKAQPPVDRASHLDIYSTTKKPKAEAKGSPEDAAEAKSGGRSWFGGKKKDKGRPPPKGLSKPPGAPPLDRKDSEGKPVPVSAAARAEAKASRSVEPVVVKEPEPEPVYAPPPEEEYIAPPKKQDKRKKFKLEKPVPSQIEEQSVQSSVQEQIVRAEPPPDQSFKRQAPPYRPPPGAPPGKAPPRGADGHSQPPPGWRPPREQEEFEKQEVKQQQMLELVKGAPKGRRPPGAPPPIRAAPPTSKDHPVQPGKRPTRPEQPHEDLALVSSDDEDPGAPDEYEEARDEGVVAPRDKPPAGGVPPPPREAPPVTGVPPPPADVPVAHLAGASAPEADIDAHLKRTVKAGRLRIRCVEAHNVHRRGSAPTKTKIDAFMRFTLGRHKKAPRKKTKIYRRSNHHPIFDDEEIRFDLVDPSDYVANGDIDLTLELFDQNAWADELICAGNISILRYMVEAGGVVETVSLKVPGEDRADTTFTGEFTFEPAVVGTCVFTLYEGRNLANMDSVGKQDPYVKLTLGETTKQSKTCEDGGTDPYFEEEELVLWIDDTAWTEDLLVQVYDEDVGLDDLIGQSNVPLLPYMAVPPQHAKEQVFELFNKVDAKKHRGELLMKLQFLPAGKLTIRCLSAKGLRNRDTLGRQDPYVIFTTSGECHRIQERTHVDQDGGTEPTWDCDVEMRVVDHHELWIECYDHDAIGSDDLIGKCKLSLLPVFKRGLIDTWVTIKEETEWGKPKPAGADSVSVSERF